MTPEQIAAGLTKAQRAAVLTLTIHWEWWAGRGTSTGKALLIRGLAERKVGWVPSGHWYPKYRLTPLGQQVHAILEKQHERG